MDTRPVLKRFEIVVLKDKGGSPNPKEQVPAEAQVTFYRQGATVSDDVTVPGNGGNAVVSIYNRGALNPNDVVQVGTTQTTLTVVGPHPANARQVMLKTSAGQAAVALKQWDRLVVLTNPPVPSYPTGALASANNSITTSAADGRGSCYIPAFRWDYVVSGAGLTTQLFVDAEGSFAMR